MSKLRRTLKIWLPWAARGVTLLLLITSGIQQGLRQSANSPQIQMANDAAAQLTKGAEPSTLIPAQSVDLATSLAPWLSVTDESGNLLASSAHLGGITPRPPLSSLTYTTTHSDNRITWQPQPGVRQATVITHYGGSKPGYVIAGRSLREVEKRESTLNLMALLGSLSLLAIAFLVIFFTCVKPMHKEKE